MMGGGGGGPYGPMTDSSKKPMSNRVKLKFGVSGNFGLLISNLNSKTRYQFEILRKCHFLSLNHDFKPTTPS